MSRLEQTTPTLTASVSARIVSCAIVGAGLRAAVRMTATVAFLLVLVLVPVLVLVLMAAPGVGTPAAACCRRSAEVS